jgi:endonuclease/exonuclease/phosphatase (EEP) superfamily protein YafD
MSQIFILLLSVFSLVTYAQVGPEGNINNVSSWWFKVLPESESHVSRGIAQSRELVPKNIKALVWNIKKAEMEKWEQEFLEFGKDKHLFILQEAYESPVFESTLDLFIGPQWDMGVSFLYRRFGDAATGTMIGSVSRPSEVIVRHSVDREPVILTPKAITFAKYPLAGRENELLVISVHAINFETTGAFKRHMDQIEEELTKHEGPVLLAGDFNTWNEGRTLYLARLAKRHKLVESDYINGSARLSFNGWFLDHLFTRGAEVKKAEVVAHSLGSDHRPFLVEFSIH